MFVRDQSMILFHQTPKIGSLWGGRGGGRGWGTIGGGVEGRVGAWGGGVELWAYVQS